MNCSVISSSISSFFSIILRAQTKFVFFYLTKKTWPYFPSPSSFSCSKSESYNFFSFLLFHDFLTHSSVGSMSSTSFTLFSFEKSWLLLIELFLGDSNFFLNSFMASGFYELSVKSEIFLWVLVSPFPNFSCRSCKKLGTFPVSFFIYVLLDFISDVTA